MTMVAVAGGDAGAVRSQPQRGRFFPAPGSDSAPCLRCLGLRPRDLSICSRCHLAWIGCVGCLAGVLAGSLMMADNCRRWRGCATQLPAARSCRRCRAFACGRSAGWRICVAPVMRLERCRRQGASARSGRQGPRADGSRLQRRSDGPRCSVAVAVARPACGRGSGTADSPRPAWSSRALPGLDGGELRRRAPSPRQRADAGTLSLRWAALARLPVRSTIVSGGRFVVRSYGRCCDGTVRMIARKWRAAVLPTIRSLRESTSSPDQVPFRPARLKEWGIPRCDKVPDCARTAVADQQQIRSTRAGIEPNGPEMIARESKTCPIRSIAAVQPDRPGVDVRTRFG